MSAQAAAADEWAPAHAWRARALRYGLNTKCGFATAATAVTAAGLAAAPGAHRPAAVAGALAQTVGVAWLLLLGWDASRRWATAVFVVALAWIPLFLVPSWVYAIDPSMLDVPITPQSAIGIIDGSLFAFVFGVLVATRVMGTDASAPARPQPTRWLPRRLAAYAALGSLSLIVLFARHGSPVEYLTHLDESSTLNIGATYLLWGVLFVKFVFLSMLACQWSGGRRVGYPLIVSGIVLLLVLFVVGSRAFPAIAAAEALVLFALLRRPVPLRALVVVALLAGGFVVFGVGTVKRYQAYDRNVPGQRLSFVGYARTIALRESVRVYVSNYADGLRLMSLARAVVPSRAEYEHGKELVRLLVHPIPRAVRPDVPRAKIIRDVFEPAHGNTFAMPLQASAYLDFGVAGVLLLFMLLGTGLRAFDRRIVRRSMSAADCLLAASVITGAAFVLRSGIPNGVALAAIDVVGTVVVAKTSLVPSRDRAAS